MPTTDALNFGPSGGLRFARNQGRSITGEALGAIRYPSPFFDIAHTYLPSSFKTMLRWCRYYFLTNPLINAVCYKMAEYPVTDLIFDGESDYDNNRWDKFFSETLHYKKFEVEAGLDYNCFHGDVQAVTEDGVFRLRDLSGKTVNVLSQDGVYRPATFKSFGKQELLEVEFSDGSTVLATPDHEWPVITQYGETVRKKTSELPCRDRNYSLIRNVAPRPEKNEDFYEGVRHGFVFGDGTLYNKGRQARAYFCGAKDKEMLKYFEGIGGKPHEDERGVIMIHGLPSSWKTLPDISSSPSYWHGFVCGFLAADGSVDVNGCTVLTQNSRTTLEVIKDQLPRIGMAAGRVRGYPYHSMFQDGYESNGEQFYLSLLKQFMEPGDLLLSSHRKKFEENFKPTKYSKYAHVTAVRETGLVDEVFCCEEMETRTFTLSNGVLTGNCYGNAFISLYFPFHKLLICKSCRCTRRIEQMKYIFREYKFVGSCPRCGHYGEFNVRDHYIRSPREIRLIRWNPEYITIQHNEATGENRYYYTIPPSMANDIRMSKRHIIERVPQVFIEALRKNKALLFSEQNIYHMQRPTIAQKDRGWGMPMILPVLKDTFYLQILRKAQECVSPQSLIETMVGLVRADDVQVGDLVRTHTGEFHPVEEKWYRDAKEDEVGIKITPTGMRAFPSVYSPHHPVMSIRRNGESRRSDTKDRQGSSIVLRNPHLYEEVLCPADQLQVGDYVLYPRGLPEEDQVIDVAKYSGFLSTGNYIYSGCSLETARAFEALECGHSAKIEPGNARKAAERLLRERSEPKRMPAFLELTEELAYILGWYAGDGSCGARYVEFTIGAEDPIEYDEALKEAIYKVFHIDCTGTEDDSVRHVTACCVILEKLIKGIIPGVAKKKKVPSEILNSPKSVKLAFLRGLFEADGSFGSAKYVLNVSSKNLSYDVYRMLISLGCIATVSKRKRKASHLKCGRVIKSGWSYPLDISAASKDRLNSLWECGDGPEIVSGKSGFFFREYFATRVCAVEEVEEDTYIDFKVVKDTTFCLPATATKNSIAIEHIVPMRLLFPQTPSATADVYSTINMSQWRDKIEQEIIRWRLDNNYIPILPIPVGQQTLGGDGRALMLSQEHRQWSEHIVAGMGVPIEFVFGGMQYSGSNVSMRILENHFLDVKTQRKQLVTGFIMPQVGAFMGWNQVPCHYRRFKMADDLQRSAFYLQLNQAGKLSDKSLLEDTDWDSIKELNRIDIERKAMVEGQRRQALSQASIQGEAQLIMAKFQMRGQKLMNEMMLPPEQGLPPQPPVPGVGQPGLSPGAEGQMMNQEMGMMNEAGMVPPMEIPPAPPLAGGEMAPLPPAMEGAQSQLATPMGSAQAAGYDLRMIAQQVVSWLNQKDDAERQHELVKMRLNNPQLYNMVFPMLQQSAGAQQNSAAMPQPEQRPARRGPEAVAL